MSTTAVSGASSIAQPGSLAQAIAGNQGLTQQDFLNLLVTQLTNQNPLEPQDDKEFLAQMAQFSTVQGVNDLGSSMSRMQASSLIGKTVDAQALVNGVPLPVSGPVQAITFKGSTVHLNVGGQDVTLDQVQQVRG